MIFMLHLIPCLAFAQEEWTTKDSIKLSKMLDGEMPIHINDAFRKELEQSLTGSYPVSYTHLTLPTNREV